ncbi:MAG: enoyl-CoA hydratase-related protein [Usitatibacter sp.]
MTPALRIERASGVVRIVMARAAVHNAFDEAMIAELDTAFAQAGGDDSVRVVVLAGDGKSFSAGADLAWMRRQSTASSEANLEDARRFAAMLQRIADCPKPTIARVQGAAMGGGVALACACDFAIASEDARFAVTEARFGLAASVIAPYLVAAVGRRQARRLAMSTIRIGAAEALAMGLVHEVAAAPRLDEAVEALAAQIRLSGPRALAEIKSFYGRVPAAPIGEETREMTAQAIARIRRTDEAREGFAAFLEKRRARWTLDS